MDHDFIAEHNFVDRYLLNRLTTAEQARFEDHFVDCPRCLEELELARDFQASLRSGISGLIQLRSVELGWKAWLRRVAGRASLIRLGLGLGLGLGTLLALWIFVVRPTGPAADVQLQISPPPRVNIPPLVNIPTRVLQAPLRSQGALPSYAIDRGLSLAIRGTSSNSGDLGLAMYDAAGERIWQQADVRPDPQGILTVTLHPDSLPPGDYRLEIVWVESVSGNRSVENYDFRLLE